MSHIPRWLLGCFLLIAIAKSALADTEAKQPSVFDLPALQAGQVRTNQAVTVLLARGDCAAAEKLLRKAIERIPHDVNARYNLACALARQGKTDEALTMLKKAVELGFRNPKHIEDDDDLKSLRENARYKTIVKKAAEPLKDKPRGWNYKVKPAEIKDGQVLLNEDNVAWNPKIGVFHPLIKLNKEATAEKPIAVGLGKAGDLLRKWYKEGTAAGNHGDLYDNHDSDHSNMNYAALPQLTRIEFGDDIKKRKLHHGLQQAFLYNGITIGNSSTALTSGPIWRSQPRIALTSPRGPAALCLQYLGSHLYFYPEHRDHDPGHNGSWGKGHGDVFPANTPYMIISQGSSGSDKVFLDAVGATLAAFRPEVKRALAKSGMLMPTVQMIFRMSNKMVEKPGDYLTGKAHPTVFDGKQLGAEKMVTMAHEMTLQKLPPIAQIKVVEEDLGVVGRDYFDVGPREKLFDTPFAIARVVKSTKYRRRMVVTAEGSKDPFGKPLTYHWVVLRGDPNRIQIKKLNKSGSRVELLVAYHERRPVAPGAKLESNRVDIGVFVNNGTYYSAPTFISFYYLDNEKRVYDSRHRIKVVDYADSSAKDNYVDPLLDFRKDWRDEYLYAADGKLLGWTRIRGKSREEFTPEGLLILKKDNKGRPIKTSRVRYVTEKGGKDVPVLKQQTEVDRKK